MRCAAFGIPCDPNGLRNDALAGRSAADRHAGRPAATFAKRGLKRGPVGGVSAAGRRRVGEERLPVDRLPYIRDVRQGPDGLLYLVTYSDGGGLFRLEPA